MSKRFLAKVESHYKIKADNETALNSYIETMLWSSSDVIDGEDVQMDSLDNELAPEVRPQAKKDLEEFYKKAEKAGVDLTKYDDGNIGHDFWLTRNGHGAGFWDGDYEDADGKTLTKISKEFKELHPLLGDDGFIHVEG